MPLRIRWMKFPVTAAGLRTCLEKMRDEDYVEGQKSGFRVSEVRRGRVDATFIERFDLEERIEDPFGRSLTFARVEFRSTRFTLTTGAPGLQIANPSRGTRPLITRLGEFLGFQVAITPIEVDVMAWLSALEDRLGKMVARRLKVSGISVTTDVGGIAEIEGSRDVRPHVKELLGKHRYVVDHVATSRDLSGAGNTIQLSRNATAMLPEAFAREFLADLRSSLTVCMPGEPRATNEE